MTVEDGEKRGEGATPEETDSKVHGFVRQVLCVLSISSCILSHGLAVAWPSVLAPNQNGTYQFPDITPTDIKWIVAIPNLSSVLLPAITVLVEIAGPLRLLVFTLPPTIATWILMAAMHSKVMIYVGRLLLGLSGAILTMVIPPLLAEVASPAVRGSLTLFFQVQLSLGIPVMYVLATVCTWEWATGICAAILMPVFVSLLFVPESPYWLVKKGRYQDAERSMRVLRGPNGDVKGEVQLIKKGLASQPSTTFRDQFSQLRVSSNYKPVILVNVIFLLLNVGGQFVVYQYAVFIFQKTQVLLDPFTCSILVGTSRLVFIILSTLVIDRMGRRKVFVGSLIVCALLYSATSLSLKYPSGPTWLPLVLIVLWSAVYALGISSTQVLVMVEVLPTAVRSIGCSLCALTTNFGTFVSMVAFPMLNDSIGMDNTFHVMAAIFVLTALVVCKFVPESRGKTLVDMQEAFASEKSRLVYRKIYQRKAKDGELDGLETDLVQTDGLLKVSVKD